MEPAALAVSVLTRVSAVYATSDLLLLLCDRYAATSRDTDDIERLQGKVADFKDVVAKLNQQLVDGMTVLTGPDNLSYSLHQCLMTIERIIEGIEPERACHTTDGQNPRIQSEPLGPSPGPSDEYEPQQQMWPSLVVDPQFPSLGVRFTQPDSQPEVDSRALEWPFRSKQVEEMVADLEMHQQTLALALQDTLKDVDLNANQEPSIAHNKTDDFASSPSTIRYNDDSISETAESIFSVVSLPSLDLPEASVSESMSAEQVAIATRWLVKLFEDDEVLKLLYKAAIQFNSRIPEIFQRNFRRLLKDCSQGLKNEATDSAEYFVARLLAVQADLVADRVVSRYWKASTEKTLPRAVAIDPVGDRTEFGPLDEEREEQLTGSTFPQGFTKAQEFLMESQAVSELRRRLQQFVVALDVRELNATPEEYNSDISEDHVFESLYQSANTITANDDVSARRSPPLDLGAEIMSERGNVLLRNDTHRHA